MEKISKYVLAQIIDFLPSREILPIRILSQKCKIAVGFIYSRRVKDISLILTCFQKELKSSFTAKEIKEYRTTFTASSTFVKDISKKAKLANTFNNGIGFIPNKSIASLVKPNVTIIYPAYFVWILFGKQIYKKPDDNPQAIWQKVKSIYKDPELEKKMTHIKISSVTQKMINVIQGIINTNSEYLNDYILLYKTGVSVRYLFEWTLNIIQYYQVYRKLKKNSMYKFSEDLKHLQLIYDYILKKDCDQ